MPTGYTDVIATGAITELKDFAMRASRGLTVMIHQRDDALDAPLKLREVHDYDRKAVERARILVEDLNNMSYSDVEEAAYKAYETARAVYRLQQQDITNTRIRYESMLSKVREWAPPTPDHVYLKEFMIDQLTTSLRLDLYEPVEPIILGPKEWFDKSMEEAQRSLDRATKRLREEEERCVEVNRWIAQLRNSLEQVRTNV